MKSYIKPSNFKVGAEFGVYIYIGVTIVSLCIAPFVFTFAPYLILPFALLVSKPIAWIALGAVFIVAAGLTFSAAKPLFDMAKDSLHRRKIQAQGFVELEEVGKKINTQNSQSTSPNSSPKVLPGCSQSNSEDPLEKSNSDTSLDSLNSRSESTKVSPSSSHSSSETFLGSLLSATKKTLSNLVSQQDDDAALAQQNLVNQVKAGNDGYWLQQHDIAHIARAVYGYSENTGNDTYFCVAGDLCTFNERLKEYAKKAKEQNSSKIFTSILNLNNMHWVTLVIVYEVASNKFRGVFCNSSSSFGVVQLPENGSKCKDIQCADEIMEIIPPLDSQVGYYRVQEKKKQADDVQKTLNVCRDTRNELLNVPIDGDTLVSALSEHLQDFYVQSSHAEQQIYDGYNCGVFALLNARDITDMLIAGKSNDDIIEKLNYKLTLEELKEIRTIFAKILENDAEWKQNQSSVLEDTCVSQVGEKKRS